MPWRRGWELKEQFEGKRGCGEGTEGFPGKGGNTGKEGYELQMVTNRAGIPCKAFTTSPELFFGGCLTTGWANG